MRSFGVNTAPALRITSFLGPENSLGFFLLHATKGVENGGRKFSHCPDEVPRGWAGRDPSFWGNLSISK